MLMAEQCGCQRLSKCQKYALRACGSARKNELGPAYIKAQSTHSVQCKTRRLHLDPQTSQNARYLPRCCGGCRRLSAFAPGHRGSVHKTDAPKAGPFDDPDAYVAPRSPSKEASAPR